MTPPHRLPLPPLWGRPEGGLRVEFGMKLGEMARSFGNRYRGSVGYLCLSIRGLGRAYKPLRFIY